jgi:hypothetical protein
MSEKLDNVTNAIFDIRHDLESQHGAYATDKEILSPDYSWELDFSKTLAQLDVVQNEIRRLREVEEVAIDMAKCTNDWDRVTCRLGLAHFSPKYAAILEGKRKASKEVAKVDE